MADDSVDLIYLDPPFNSKRQWSAPIGSAAAGAAFKDAWTYSDIDAQWVEEIQERQPALASLIQTVAQIGGKGDAAYLIMMALRLMEMERVLKPSGSIYLHCDPTMSHPLKLTMDCVFGHRNYRNEIVWGYEKPRPSSRIWRRNHDILLFYGGEARTFHVQRVPLMDGTFKMRKPFKRPDGTVWLPKEPGKAAGSWWYDIPSFATRMTAKERTGFPTQKPLALLDRIIRASSDEGDIVLDPFCGCATACVAAERLNRQWIGIDISEKAIDLVKTRFVRELGMYREVREIIHRTDIPALREPYNKKELRKALYFDQDGKCAECRIETRQSLMDLDHRVPKAKGGPDRSSNLQLLCRECNSAKGTLSTAEFRARRRKMGIGSRYPHGDPMQEVIAAAEKAAGYGE